MLRHLKPSRASLLLVLSAVLCAPTAVARSPKAIVTGNYSGYRRTDAAFTAVSASWQVPLIAFGVQKHVVSMSAEWIGIGGAISPAIVQIGTVHQLDGGGFRTYEAFYELYPTGLVTIPAGRVVPGDVIVASVRCASHCTPSQSGQTWTLSLQDVTQNWQWSKDFGFVSDLGSAEIVEEVSTETGHRLYALPDFGTVSFENITINGAPANLKSSERILLRADGTANTSEPNAARDGFKVCWGDGRAYASCTATAPEVSAGQ